MTDSILDVAKALSSKLTATVTAQKKLAWTTPAHRRKLDDAQSTVGKLSETIAVSLKVSAGTGAATKGKTDALSLGVGVSAKTAAAVKAGVSLGVGFSAKASLSAALVANLHSAVALVGELDGHLAAMNVTSARVAGTNGVMPPGRPVDGGAVDGALRDLTSKLGEAQGQADASVPPTPKSPLTGEIRMPRVGAWHSDLVTDDETALSGKVSFKIDDLTFVGTVVPEKTGLDGSRARCHVVGGNGGLAKTIPGKSYTGSSVKVGAVLRDILHACGEDLSDLSDGPTLEKQLPRWHVSSGPAEAALNDLATAAGAAWRVLRDGTIWFGAELWPEVTPDHVLVDEDWSAGALTLAPDTADMVPGVVYRGHKIEHVIHQLDEKLRTEVRTDHPRAALDRYLAGQRRQVDYSREWPCRVVTQNPDYTLQLDPDDDAMKGSGLDKVPIRYGMPGMRAKLKPGARCHLAFAAGDPSRPFAHNWESDENSVDSIEFTAGGRSAPLARVGDPVDVFFALGIPIPLIGGLIVPGSPLPVPFAPGTTITFTTPVQAVISSGNGKVLG